MVSYGKCVKRPFSSFKSLCIGAIVAMLPIVNFALYGFLSELARTGKLSWSPFGQRWVEGLKAFIVLIIYSLPALAVGGFIALTESDSLYLFIAFVFCVFFTVYFYPSALVVMARRKMWSSGFSSAVFGKAFSVKYFFTWVFAQILAILMGILVGLPGALLSFTYVVPAVLWWGAIPYVVSVIIVGAVSEIS